MTLATSNKPSIARAIESQCYVIAAAQCGRHNQKRSSYGHSLVVDPWGQIVEEAGGFDDESYDASVPSLIFCNIDMDTLKSVRTQMPIEQHRKDATWS